MPVDRRSDKARAQSSTSTRSGGGRPSTQLQDVIGNDGTKNAIDQGLIQTKTDQLAAQKKSDSQQEETSILGLAETEIAQTKTIDAGHPDLVEAGIDETMLAELNHLSPRTPKDDVETSLGMGIAVVTVLARVWGTALEADGWIPTALAMVAVAARNHMPMDRALEVLVEAFVETGDPFLQRLATQLNNPESEVVRELTEFFYLTGARVQDKVAQGKMEGADPLTRAVEASALDAERIPTRIEIAVVRDEAAQEASTTSGPLQSGSSDEPR